jgi:hypothetical protein
MKRNTTYHHSDLSISHSGGYNKNLQDGLSKGTAKKVSSQSGAYHYCRRLRQNEVWMTLHPGWDTLEGREYAISSLIKRWSGITKDRNCDPNTIFLKATVPRLESGKEDIVRVAIWAQASMVDGCGNTLTNYLDKVMDVNALYLGNLAEQNYPRQLLRSFHVRRVETANEVVSSSSPAIMILGLCAVDLAFQRLGVATKLVEWGLDEAKRRDRLESTLEALSMGRHVIRSLGIDRKAAGFSFRWMSSSSIMINHQSSSCVQGGQRRDSLSCTLNMPRYLRCCSFNYARYHKE